MREHEGIQAWIGRQPWSEAVKSEALELHERRVALNLNPFTLGQWKTWAASR